MGKILNTRDILLLGLSGALDLFEEIKDPLRLVSSSYKNMYGWVPDQYKKHNFSHLIWRSIKTGYIEKIEKKGEIYLRLTPQGNQKVARDFPLISFQNKHWDKKWRIVTFDIQEINRKLRDNLRSKLKELGFGMLQKSVFISPHDILQDFSEFIKYAGLSEAVYVFEASTLAVGNLRELASKVWKLDDLNEKYRDIIDKAQEIKNSHLTKSHDRGVLLKGADAKLNKSDSEKMKALRDLKSDYVEILLHDPFLPKELLPTDWMGERAKKIIKICSGF